VEGLRPEYSATQPPRYTIFGARIGNNQTFVHEGCQRQLSTPRGHSLAMRRTAGVNPKATFKVGPMIGQDVRESGLKASVASIPVIHKSDIGAAANSDNGRCYLAPQGSANLPSATSHEAWRGRAHQHCLLNVAQAASL
jgi:hypothetical protein